MVSSAMEPTPNELDLVIDFVNTLDLETSSDALAGEGLQQWFESHGLLESDAGALDERDRGDASACATRCAR